MRKPIFNKKWYHGKPPVLQIKILKSIIIAGRLSKKKLTHMLHSNYPDVSNAMDALVTRRFLKLSDVIQTSGRNPEKFYKITEQGLRALLEIELYQDEFWKVIILLCICSKKRITGSEFEDYYHKFELNYFGYVNIRGYFFLTRFFDKILDEWLQAHTDPPLISTPQKLIECLAFKGPCSIEKLEQNIRTKEKDILNVIDIYSIQSNNASQKSNISANRKVVQSIDQLKTINYDIMDHSLVITKETSEEGTIYELSIFGIMLVMAIINYHHGGRDTFRDTDGIHNNFSPRPKLFYNDVAQVEYCDTIARNYKNKIPLIFGKWDFLKSQLGSVLYDGFDFLIYKSSRSLTIDSSIWSFGSKEFYEDMLASTYNAIEKLDLVHRAGITTLEEYTESQEWIANDPRIIPVCSKLREIGEILMYADITSSFEKLGNVNHLPDRVQPKPHTINEIKNIERVFRDELSFLFYLSLNTTFLPSSYKDTSAHTIIEDGMRIIPLEVDDENQDIFKFGSPRQRLMAVLANDKDIKQWFSRWIADIIEYRMQISRKMSEFYDEVIKANENDEKKEKVTSKTGKKAITTLQRDEYDMTGICSDLDSVYDHTL